MLKFPALDNPRIIRNVNHLKEDQCRDSIVEFKKCKTLLTWYYTTRFKLVVMKTKDLAQKSGLDRETLRFYESKGLISKPRRTDSGYRVYPEEVLEQIEFIRQAKSAGFTLSEVAELLKLKSSRITCRIGRDIALQKLQEINEKAKAIKKMKRTLQRFVEICELNGEKGLSSPCHLSFNRIKNGSCCE